MELKAQKFLKEFQNRVVQAISEILLGLEKKIVVIAHGIVINSFLLKIINKDLKHYKELFSHKLDNLTTESENIVI